MLMWPTRKEEGIGLKKGQRIIYILHHSLKTYAYAKSAATKCAFRLAETGRSIYTPMYLYVYIYVCGFQKKLQTLLAINTWGIGNKVLTQHVG